MSIEPRRDRGGVCVPAASTGAGWISSDSRIGWSSSPLDLLLDFGFANFAHAFLAAGMISRTVYTLPVNVSTTKDKRKTYSSSGGGALL
jgi:hypothetical protein